MASKTAARQRAKGTGTIQKIDNRFYITTTENGKRKSKMLRHDNGRPVTTRPDAEAAAAKLTPILTVDTREELAAQVAITKKLKRQSGLRLADAWDTYLKQINRPDSGAATLAQYKKHFGLFLAWIQGERPVIERVADIDDDTAKSYMAFVWNRGVSSRTYNAYLQALKMVFRHLGEPAALDANPFDAILRKPSETVSRKEFTETQVAAIFDGFNKGFTDPETGAEYKPMHADEMRVLLNLCCFTGCRGEDGCLMEWQNIDLERGLISYIPRKTARRSQGKAVTLPMHPQLKEVLDNAQSWRGENKAKEDYVIPQVAHRYHKTPTGIQADVMRIIRCATGLQTTATNTIARRRLRANAYSLHSFRHTFVSFCANAGVPLAVVAEIVGHGSPAMTRHYSHISTAAKQTAIAALPVIGEVKTVEAPESVVAKRAALLAAISRANDSQVVDYWALLTEAARRGEFEF